MALHKEDKVNICKMYEFLKSYQKIYGDLRIGKVDTTRVLKAVQTRYSSMIEDDTQD